jgi:hypothetical protein
MTTTAKAKKAVVLAAERFVDQWTGDLMDAYDAANEVVRAVRSLKRIRRREARK